MNDKNMRMKAIEILLCKQDDIEEIAIPEQNAIYYRNTKRGGGALIISTDGTMLFADPFFVEYDKHLQNFINGDRSIFE